MKRPQHMSHGTWDAANGTAAVGFVASYLAGFNWPSIAAFLAAIYSLILIIEKLWPRLRRLFKQNGDGDS